VPPRWVIVLLVLYTVIGLTSVLAPHIFHHHSP